MGFELIKLPTRRRENFRQRLQPARWSRRRAHLVSHHLTAAPYRLGQCPSRSRELPAAEGRSLDTRSVLVCVWPEPRVSLRPGHQWRELTRGLGFRSALMSAADAVRKRDRVLSFTDLRETSARAAGRFPGTAVNFRGNRFASFSHPQLASSISLIASSEPQTVAPNPHLSPSDHHLTSSEPQLVVPNAHLAPLEPQVVATNPHLAPLDHHLTSSETQVVQSKSHLAAVLSQRHLTSSEIQIVASDPHFTVSDYMAGMSEREKCAFNGKQAKPCVGSNVWSIPQGESSWGLNLAGDMLLPSEMPQSLMLPQLGNTGARGTEVSGLQSRPRAPTIGSFSSATTGSDRESFRDFGGRCSSSSESENSCAMSASDAGSVRSRSTDDIPTTTTLKETPTTLDGEAEDVGTQRAFSAGGSSGKNGKPPVSFIELISKAILSSPNNRMMLHEIYRYIMAQHPYYNNDKKAWRNSVRHNLSLNECFEKFNRTENGKGHLWRIHPNCIDDFMRGDFRRRRARQRARNKPVASAPSVFDPFSTTFNNEGYGYVGSSYGPGYSGAGWPERRDSGMKMDMTLTPPVALRQMVGVDSLTHLQAGRGPLFPRRDTAINAAFGTHTDVNVVGRGGPQLAAGAGSADRVQGDLVDEREVRGDVPSPMFPSSYQPPQPLSVMSCGFLPSAPVPARRLPYCRATESRSQPLLTAHLPCSSFAPFHGSYSTFRTFSTTSMTHSAAGSSPSAPSTWGVAFQRPCSDTSTKHPASTFLPPTSVSGSVSSSPLETSSTCNPSPAYPTGSYPPSDSALASASFTVQGSYDCKVRDSVYSVTWQEANVDRSCCDEL